MQGGSQLAEWGRHRCAGSQEPEKSDGDPASVVFDGVQRRSRRRRYFMIDTAGRLQNKDNPPGRVGKIGRIIKRTLPDAPHETL